jgi:hypothetical protein
VIETPVDLIRGGNRPIHIIEHTFDQGQIQEVPPQNQKKSEKNPGIGIYSTTRLDAHSTSVGYTLFS